MIPHNHRLTLLLVVVALGCGKGETGPETTAVAGIVTLDGEPLPDADVTFAPKGKTPGLGGTARTDQAGKFVLTSARGGEGAPAGEYRVTVSRLLTADGSPVPPDVEPIEMTSPASESLPPIYSNPQRTQLTATVQPGGEPITLELKSPGGG